MLKRLGWTLIAVGSACGLFAVPAFIITLILGAQEADLPSGPVTSAASSIAIRLPALLRWGGGQELNNATGFAMLALAIAAVLLLIAGGRIARVLGVVSLAFLTYYGITFSRGAYWQTWMGEQMNRTPLVIAFTAWIVLVIMVAFTAITTGRQLLRGDAAPVSA